MKNTPPLRFKSYLLPLSFLALLWLHFADHLLDWLPEPAINERRALAEKPELDLTFLDPYPKDFEKYYNDHFNWRNYFIKANAFISYHTFKKSALPDKVLIGREGWLFKSGFQLEMYRGKFRFNRQQLEEIRKELDRRAGIVASKGGRYYFVIVPMKHHIYPEFLPANVSKINPESCKDQLVAYLQQNSALNVLDLSLAILKKKQQTDTLLYMRTDHHWNTFAALEGARVLVDRLREDFPQIPPVKPEDYHFTFDEYNGLTLAQMLGLENQTKEWFAIRHYQGSPAAKDSSRYYPPPHDFPFPDEYALARYSGRTDLPRLFMVRESFANYLLDILAERFEYSFFLFDNWKHEFNQEIYEQEGGDIYIQMIWEGLLFALLENPPEGAGW